MLSGIFGAVALLLAGLGLYGVTSFSVNRRRAEIGIRMALGATPGRVVGLVLSRVCRVVCLGVLVGLGISIWVSKLVAPLLYGLDPGDPVTPVFGSRTCDGRSARGWFPAQRAARVDPADSFRGR